MKSDVVGASLGFTYFFAHMKEPLLAVWGSFDATGESEGGGEAVSIFCISVSSVGSQLAGCRAPNWPVVVPLLCGGEKSVPGVGNVVKRSASPIVA